MKGSFEIRGNIVDVEKDSIYLGIVEVENGRIADVRETGSGPCDRYILPGLVDSHIHIESSMMPPSRFASVALLHGTTGVITDPHEIANVAGIPGIRYMMADAHAAPLKFGFTVPSCVPATPFETSGASIGPAEVEELMARDDVVALGEMMNYPGVINGDGTVMAKIEAAKKHGKPVDGHAPLLRGDDLESYIAAGISTDHECTGLDEAREKVSKGMRIQVRDGSASKDLDVLWPLINEADVFLASDDKHPGDLLRGHMDRTISRAISLGADPLRTIKAATRNPSEHYGLGTGRMRPGDPADLVVVGGLERMDVREVYIDGKHVVADGRSAYVPDPLPFPSCMNLPFLGPDTFDTHLEKGRYRTMVARGDSLLTEKGEFTHDKGDFASDGRTNIIAVVSRYGNGSFGVGFVEGFSIDRGAIGSTVAHDSHNLVMVGRDSPSMKMLAEALSETGGMGVVVDGKVVTMPLEIAGLMSAREPSETARMMRDIEEAAGRTGCALPNPFMTLSFMSLLVIPHLKLSDQGLFDVDSFSFTTLKI